MSARTYSSRLLIALLLVFGITAALALGVRWLAGVRARMTAPTRGATWIWEPRNKRDLSPTAFYALRDFTLERVPKSARLLVQADEEYVLSMNAKRLGAGRYREGAPLDAYEVAPWLLPGANRLVVELRSGRGAGGFLLSLQDGEGRPIVESGPGFRIVRRHQLGLVRGILPMGDAPAAFSWGLPPLGRWGWPRLDGTTAALPARIRGGALPAVRSRETAPLTVLFDWGREVDGYLELELPEPAETDEASRVETGLLWVGKTPPDPARAVPTGSVLPLPEARSWLDPVPRRLRYAVVAGLPPRTGDETIQARILPVDPATVPAEPPAPRGLLGIEPPPLRTPVEDEVRRKLERVARLALGEKR